MNSPGLRVFFIITLVLTSLLGNTQDIKVEPPNWWVGMRTKEIQLLLHANEDLSGFKAKTDYQGVLITGYQGLSNNHYLTIDIEIQESAEPGIVEIMLENHEKIRTVSFPVLKRDLSNSPDTIDSRDVIYLITPDRFSNQNTANDNIDRQLEIADRFAKNGRHGGDIQGIIHNIPYIFDMGFTTLWSNPLLDNNMPRYSYHGYAITDFYNVDPRFGSNELYKELCAQAHNKGLKVMMDMVINHCGLNHWWMADLPSADWINYQDQPYTETSHRKTVQLDPYSSVADLKVLEQGWFVRTMPDLNVTNPVLGQYMIQNSIWWIEYAGIDGIRMDTYLYPDKNYMATWAKAVRSEYPTLFIAGEVWYEQPAVLAYWQEGNNNADGYESNLPSVFDFALNYSLLRALNTDEGWNSGWLNLYETLGLDFLYPNSQNLVVFADNHDMSRLYAQLDHDVDKVKMALAFVLTTRGIPQIYYGTEILTDSPVNRDDGLLRSDFPGGWKDDKINAFTGEGLTEEQTDMQLFLKKLLHWRKEADAIHHGKLLHFVPEKGVYVYFRYTDDQKVMIILNKNKDHVTLPLQRFSEVLEGITAGTNVLTEEKISLQKEIQLYKPGPVILELKR